MERADRVDAASRTMREAEMRIARQRQKVETLKARGMFIAAAYAQENLAMMVRRLLAIRSRHTAIMKTARLQADLRRLEQERVAGFGDRLKKELLF